MTPVHAWVHSVPKMTTEANIELPISEEEWDSGVSDEGEILVALRKRYPAPAFALLTQVSNATGGRRSRIADAIAMGLWPSRGIEMHGFEIKVRREDWLGELKNPAKADVFTNFCHRWWLVAGDDKIVRPGELPPNWGLLVFKPRGLFCEKEAPLLTPKPPTLELVAAILRRVQDSYVLKKDIAKMLHAERAESDERARRMYGEKGERLEKLIADFEKASGVRMSRWGDNATDIGEAVYLILENRDAIRKAHFDNLRAQARASLDTLDAIAAVITPKEEDAK